MRVAREVLLSEDERKSLERRARARISSARSVERARIVLLASSGLQDQQIAAQLKITPEKAARWRNRFLDGGLEALEKDAPRPGRTPAITTALVQEVIHKTTREKPDNATHWSTRSMAAATGLSEKHPQNLAQARSEAPSGANLQGQQRPGFCREAGGHRGPLPQPA